MSTSDGGTFYPGTSTPVTHSFEERQMIAEFDDALLDQASWKNSRYAGSKLSAKAKNTYKSTDSKINTTDTSSGEYLGQYVTVDTGDSVWGGDVTYQNLPVLPYTSTAMYIANTVIGGEEDPQFATIRNHSYVGINRILLINQDTETVQILDRASENYEEFHRFITNDFPTGNKCKVKVIDESISTNLKGAHRVKMNKGFLFKSFEFKHAGEVSGSVSLDSPPGAASHFGKVLTENNSIYLYKSGSMRDNYRISGSIQANLPTASLGNQLRLRYGVIETLPGSAGNGHMLDESRVGPYFHSSSIIENKFTKQYYSGSFGLIVHNPYIGAPYSMSKFLATTGLGSASRFIANDTLGFLTSNNSNPVLSEQEKTEVHITFFEGTKDFAPNYHDERSIGTFEVDQNLGALGVEQAGACSDGLPTNHEIVFKGRDDGRFLPTLNTYYDSFVSGHAVNHTLSQIASLCAGSAWPLDLDGCTPINKGLDEAADDVGCTDQILQVGLAVDKIDNADVYVQGGALGEVGYKGVFSSSAGSSYGVSMLDQSGDFNMTADNFYSGSFSYEMSFLDKDHTLILNLDKEEELFEGIGEKGLLVLPYNLDPQVAFNIEYYLEKAGVIDNTSANQQQISPNTRNN